MSKIVYMGLEGSGKTLLMSCDAYELVYRNANWKEKTGKDRPIVSNIKFTDSFLKFAKSKGIFILYWKDIEELVQMTECDLFIDEIGAYFDSRTFDSLPLNVRLWLAQADKLGVHIIGGAQDWSQIDVSYRRLVKQLYDVKKVVGTRRPSATRPGAKKPWALVLRYKVAPVAGAESTELKTLSMFPHIHFFWGKHFRRFDTNSRVEDSAPPPLKRVVRHWTNPETGKVEFTRVRYF